MKLARVRHFERNVAGGAAAAADFFVHLLATYGEEKGVDVADEIEELRHALLGRDHHSKKKKKMKQMKKKENKYKKRKEWGSPEGDVFARLFESHGPPELSKRNEATFGGGGGGGGSGGGGDGFLRLIHDAIEKEGRGSKDGDDNNVATKELTRVKNNKDGGGGGSGSGSGGSGKASARRGGLLSSIRAGTQLKSAWAKKNLSSPPPPAREAKSLRQLFTAKRKEIIAASAAAAAVDIEASVGPYVAITYNNNDNDDDDDDDDDKEAAAAADAEAALDAKAAPEPAPAPAPAPAVVTVAAVVHTDPLPSVKANRAEWAALPENGRLLQQEKARRWAALVTGANHCRSPHPAPASTLPPPPLPPPPPPLLSARSRSLEPPPPPPPPRPPSRMTSHHPGPPPPPPPPSLVPPRRHATPPAPPRSLSTTASSSSSSSSDSSAAVLSQLSRKFHTAATPETTTFAFEDYNDNALDATVDIGLGACSFDLLLVHSCDDGSLQESQMTYPAK